VARVPSYDLALFFSSETSHSWGVDVFSGRLPDRPHEAIAFSDQGGVAPLNVFGGVGLRQPSLQVMVRADALDYLKSRALIDEVFAVLHCRVNVVANGREYKAIDAVQEPIWLGYDESERPMWSLNFSLMFGGGNQVMLSGSINGAGGGGV
jgi:hypothetical protein